LTAAQQFFRLQIPDTSVNVMTGHPAVSELLERYMEDSCMSEQWIMAKDLRTCFHLDASRGPAISGFLGKIYHGAFFSCRIKCHELKNTMTRSRRSGSLKGILSGNDRST